MKNKTITLWIASLALAMTILLSSSTSHAFRRLPYSANPNQLCTMCERVAGEVPTMTVRVSLSTDFMFDAVYEAAHTWNVEGNSMFTFGVTGETTIYVADDNKNAVIMGNYMGICQDDILGLSIPQPPYPIVTSPGTDPEGPKFTEIVERDLVICEGQDWFVGSEDDIGWWDYDLVSVILHELGHHLGLGHSNCNGNSPDVDCTFEDDTGAVMDTAVLSWWWGDTRRHLKNQPSGGFTAQGDVQGILHIYGTFNPDLDSDGVVNEQDNCVKASNSDQLNTDGDFTGDVCDDDDDNDGILDAQDNCELIKNPAQGDNDSDGIGNECDDDDDNDGVADGSDNCPLISNADQADLDGDGTTDACDDDDDNDGASDAADNCPMLANADQLDTDDDGVGNLCSDDDDGDGVGDATDNCPLKANASQKDDDKDKIGNACDPHTMTQAELNAMAMIYKMGQNPYHLSFAQFCKMAFASKGYWPDGCK